ncbi:MULTISPECIES: phage holin family protein [Acidobacteriaceae]|uniref:phage holin family protein n=1 Tax=Acidobacteriaceae TaxID=204434 RepID=UPI00131CD854|nr:MULTISPECIES: phage holin family protein [Acidobacteriaceae]MDW5264875.1 phage holin family protein [Edaphobacter sp.]
MLRLLLHWILNAVALLLVSHFVEGFHISGLISALIAVVVIGLFNATLGLFLKIITLPLGILTFGIFFLVINAVILWFSSKFVPGFAVTTFSEAFWGALVLAVLHLLFGFIGLSKKKHS